MSVPTPAQAGLAAVSALGFGVAAYLPPSHDAARRRQRAIGHVLARDKVEGNTRTVR
jgi:hypothetical protein